MTANPRALALDLLQGLEKGRLTLDLLLDRADAGIRKLGPADRRLFTALLLGVQRRREHLDHMIGKLSNTPFSRLDPKIKNILRLGLFQIFFMDKIPDRAAVDTSVNLAKTTVGPWAGGFVNAVLRGALRKKDVFDPPDPEKDPKGHLRIQGSLPLWMARRLVDRMGLPAALALAEKLNRPPPVTLRANTLKASRDELLAAVKPFARKAKPGAVCPEAVRLWGLKAPVHQLPGFDRGHFQVQDEAAQLIGHLADPKPGQRVLDACAGLGGKTGHMAALMDNRGLVAASDVSGGRLFRLKGEMRRISVRVLVVIQDLTAPCFNPAVRFDRVLLDAPCSGMGVIRRNPDAKWRLKPKDLPIMAARQSKFLDAAALLTAPGGKLVYAVCSTEPEETDQVGGAFLDRHPEFRLSPDVSREFLQPFMNESGYFSTSAAKDDMDGFFAAVFQKA